MVYVDMLIANKIGRKEGKLPMIGLRALALR